MRKIPSVIGEHYHVFNRGVNKQVIFHDTGDYNRFLFLLLYLQSNIKFAQMGRLIDKFVQHRVLDILEDVVEDRKVELVAFCIMPNHFHLILKECGEAGVANYMQRILNAYGKYYNTKYQKSGHVFQGPYRNVHITDDRQLLYLSSYLHRNPREISRWKTDYFSYPWSSCGDFCIQNRWGNLLKPGIILDQFKDSNKYKKFIETSTAKLLEEELDYLNLPNV